MATQLDIREQTNLPLIKQAAIAVDGIQHRLFRSCLTLGVVVLAVAFLANVLVENSLARASRRGVRNLAWRHQELSSLAAFIHRDLTPREMAQRLGDLPADGWIRPALGAWIGVPGDDLAAFIDDGIRLLEFDAWFDHLAPGHQRILAGNMDRESVFRMLADPERRDAFAQTARGIPLRLPEGLLEFVARRETVLTALDRAAQHLAAARSAFYRAAGSDDIIAWLARHDAQTVTAVLQSQRLRIPPDRQEALMRRARERVAEGRLLTVLRDPRTAAAWRDQFGRVFDQNTALETLAHRDEAAAWFAGRFDGMDAAAVLAAARRIVDRRRLMTVDALLTANYGTGSGLDAGMFWLLVVSFLVCIAGITNAMLVSVLERFREIATMKCLGALNGFIARLSLIEAAFLGLIGGLLGVVLGGIIAIVRMVMAYGQWVWRFFPWGDLGEAAVIAVFCGLALATLSALYPAFAAARMVPMEAMRVE